MDHTSNYAVEHVPAPRSVLAATPTRWQRHTSDIVVVGGGAAGLMAALQAAQHADVLLLNAGDLRISNSAWAQGGIAAALAADDSPQAHVADTLVAGAGLSDRGAVDVLAREAPAVIADLAALGVPFERTPNGFTLGLEGGHARRRIVHAGDATGWAIMQTLIARAQNDPRIRIRERLKVVDLVGGPEICEGVLALDATGGWHLFSAHAVILATGGCGALYGLSSNPPHALGEGIALAYRAGAEVCDMEFVQFHPTVLRTENGQGLLISEAVRGEGARLLSPSGRRFMPEFDPRAELAPRDIVARGIFTTMQQEASDHVLLDLTHLPPAYIKQRFPTIYRRCRDQCIDITAERIPVAPAAHYMMGGVRTDLHGATNIRGLYAAGEVACTGVHGANRLASNSLLECLVFGRRAAVAALDYAAQTPVPQQPHLQIEERTVAAPVTDWRAVLATALRAQAGIVRTATGLDEALDALREWPLMAASPDAEAISAANAGLVAQLIVFSALLREESRGAHFRSDFPKPEDAWQVHTVLKREQPPFAVATVAEPASVLALPAGMLAGRV